MDEHVYRPPFPNQEPHHLQVEVERLRAELKFYKQQSEALRDENARLLKLATQR